MYLNDPREREAFLQRLTKVFIRLFDPNEGTALGAINAMRQMCKTAEVSFHDLRIAVGLSPLQEAKERIQAHEEWMRRLNGLPSSFDYEATVKENKLLRTENERLEAENNRLRKRLEHWRKEFEAVEQKKERRRR